MCGESRKHGSEGGIRVSSMNNLKEMIMKASRSLPYVRRDGARKERSARSQESWDFLYAPGLPRPETVATPKGAGDHSMPGVRPKGTKPL